MATQLRITDIERIVVNVPLTPRCAEANAREVWQWSISEVIRVSTDAGIVGYGETLPHYTWGRVPDEAIERVKGQQPGRLPGRRFTRRGLADGAVRCRRQGARRPRLSPVQPAARARGVPHLVVEHRHAARDARRGSAGGGRAGDTPATRSRPGRGGTFTSRSRRSPRSRRRTSGSTWTGTRCSSTPATPRRCCRNWTGRIAWRFTRARSSSATSKACASSGGRSPSRSRCTSATRLSRSSCATKHATASSSAAASPACCARARWRPNSTSHSGFSWSARA